MKIVSKKKKGTKVLESLKFNTHVQTVSEVSKDVADALICSQEGVKWLERPLNGKAYLTYPLSVIVEVDINAETTGELLWQLAQAYKEIYADEDKSIKNIKETPDQSGVSLNRNQTDGNYGIWGHYLRDLYFESIAIYENGVIDIGIGS